MHATPSMHRIYIWPFNIFYFIYTYIAYTLYTAYPCMCNICIHCIWSVCIPYTIHMLCVYSVSVCVLDSGPDVTIQNTQPTPHTLVYTLYIYNAMYSVFSIHRMFM